MDRVVSGELFDLGSVQPLKQPGVLAGIGIGKISYTKYAPKYPYKCDDCMQVALEANRAGDVAPLARSARFTRTQGDQRVRVCAEHKALREATENVEIVREQITRALGA